MMSFTYGKRSIAEMDGMHPDLKRVLLRAITLTKQDYTIFDGVRTAKEQMALYAKGVTQRDGYTRKSEHQIQDTGYGHAADLVPWIDGRPQWDWEAIYPIAEAMFEAARIEQVEIRWGGCWQNTKDINVSPKEAVAAYVRRKRKAGKRAFNDGPHWELVNARHIGSNEPQRFVQPLPTVAPLPTVSPLPPVEPLGRDRISQSTTLRAQVVQWFATFGTGGMALWQSSDDQTRMIIAGGVVIAFLAGCWIFKERLQKWVDGDR